MATMPLSYLSTSAIALTIIIVIRPLDVIWTEKRHLAVRARMIYACFVLYTHSLWIIIRSRKKYSNIWMPTADSWIVPSFYRYIESVKSIDCNIAIGWIGDREGNGSSRGWESKPKLPSWGSFNVEYFLKSWFRWQYYDWRPMRCFPLSTWYIHIKSIIFQIIDFEGFISVSRNDSVMTIILHEINWILFWVHYHR